MQRAVCIGSIDGVVVARKEDGVGFYQLQQIKIDIASLTVWEYWTLDEYP